MSNSEPEFCLERRTFRWILSGDVVDSFPSFILRKIEFDRKSMYIEYTPTLEHEYERRLLSYLRCNSRLYLKMLDRDGAIVESWDISHEIREVRSLPARVLDYSSSENAYPCVALKIREIGRSA